MRCCAPRLGPKAPATAQARGEASGAAARGADWRARWRWTSCPLYGVPAVGGGWTAHAVYRIDSIKHAALRLETLYGVQHAADLDGVTRTARRIDVQQGTQQCQCRVTLLRWQRGSKAFFFLRLQRGWNRAAMHAPQQIGA